MTGPLYRFRALTRWWLLLAAMTALTIGLAATQNPADGWILATAYAIVFVIIWVPSIVLMILIPRLRGFIALVFGIVAIGGVTLVPQDLGMWETPILMGLVFVVLVVGGKLNLPVVLKGEVRIHRSIGDVYALVRPQPRSQTWQRMVAGIEPHPDDPHLLRATTAPPFSRQIPHFDIELELERPDRELRWRAFSDQGPWKGSTCHARFEQRDGDTVVTYVEHSRVPLLGCLISWLDRGGQDAMYELKFYAEGLPNWTISAGNGRWWPTWSQPQDASVF